MMDTFWNKVEVIGGTKEQNQKIKEAVKNAVESEERCKKLNHDLKTMKINRYKRHLSPINKAFRFVQEAIDSNFDIVKTEGTETKFQRFIRSCIFNQNTLSKLYQYCALDDALKMGALSQNKYDAMLNFINYDFEAGERNPEDLKIILLSYATLYFKRTK